MGNSNSSVRFASPNERRVISREDLDYYRSLYVGGIYTSHDPKVDFSARSTYLPGLRRCLKDHPPLSVVVKDAHTEKPFYQACAVADLSQHIEILPAANDSDEVTAVEKASAQILDTKPSTEHPPWKIFVLPLARSDTQAPSKCFIAFAFSHGLGDGISGLAFHKSFLAGLQDPSAEQYLKPAKGAMPEPYDTRKNLPISLGFLLAPALGQYLPKFLAKLFGLRAAVSTISETTWLGNGTCFVPEDVRTSVKVLRVDGAMVTSLLAQCRKHDTKFTALLHQIIVYALSYALPDAKTIDSFASQTAINMRHHVDASNDSMGLYVSGYFDTHVRTTSIDGIWGSARSMNSRLQECAQRKQDHSVGLLRFLLNIRPWITGHVGGKRDASYEVSNLLAFAPSVETEQQDIQGWSLGNMVFAQPTNVQGAPLCFNVVARKDADLIITITWQPGALGVGDDEKESVFVDHVVGDMKKCMYALVASD